jgi:hypothetical protein
VDPFVAVARTAAGGSSSLGDGQVAGLPERLEPRELYGSFAKAWKG